jgi:hypothetical protein
VTAQYSGRIGSETSPTGITIRNSSELAVLAGNLNLFAKRANVTLENSKLSAGRGLKVDADAFLKGLSDGNGDADKGIVNIRNAQLLADSIRVRAFSGGGDSLIIDGSTFKASQLIQLYAEGASTLRFRNRVTLQTALAILAGKTVTVDSGGLVKISGKAKVYTENPDFNKLGFGSIQAGKGLTINDGLKPPFKD